ncbi:hypothetical protein AB0D27_37700 [Streptomyces sp. NPDC048415]|uniref:hypothetical protein n=1 Tax=Streptomyces sp. NPDC048415 TaxID=3154822 RepID=UPI00342DCB3B
MRKPTVHGYSPDEIADLLKVKADAVEDARYLVRVRRGPTQAERDQLHAPPDIRAERARMNKTRTAAR